MCTFALSGCRVKPQRLRGPTIRVFVLPCFVTFFIFSSWGGGREGGKPKPQTSFHSNQRTARKRSVRVSPHVWCQVYQSTRYQASVSNTVTEATGFRSIPTSIHKYPSSISCHVPRWPIPSRHISHRMRPNELPQNTFSNNTYNYPSR